MIDSKEDPGRKELLKSAYRKIEELRARLTAVEGRENEPVAVIGMGCRFPGGVTDADSFWKLLSTGSEGITDIPSDRWDVDAFYDPDPDAPGKMYVRRGGFIGNVRAFDPLLFHVSPQEASSMDPQQRILLEIAWEALENAGQAPDQLSGSPTGVFIGLAGNDYAVMSVLLEQSSADTTHVATGGSHSIAAGRISYFFGLRGQCVAVDTACASGLTAIQLAAQSLRKGESKMALAGSVNLIVSQQASVVISKARMLSPDGRCKTFDKSADGYVRSEGCAILVLKLLSQAQADGDRVLAVIRGVASNQDGRTNGITAPNGNAQREVIQAALAASKLKPADIDYIETHGTGTSLGDPIEVQALGEVFGPDRPADRKLILGAVKTNIGHLEPAAGMAAVSKVIVSLQHEQIPPNLHFNNPNPLIAWNSLPFVVPTEMLPWKPGGDLRRAGVSGFGFSGTNVHVVLEQAPRRLPPVVENDRPCHLLTLSAQAPKALSELVERYVNFLNQNPNVNLADVCFTANTGRAQLAHRLGVVTTNLAELKARLQGFLSGAADSVQTGRAPSQPPPIGWLIATESLGEAHRQLYQVSPAFKAAIDACESMAIELFGTSFPASVWTQPTPGTAMQSPASQILAFALGYAMAAQWREWGLKPSVVSGLGIGRCVAAVVVGAISLRDGLRLAVDAQAAGKVAWSAPQTTLLSALGGSAFTIDLLKDPSQWTPAAQNQPALADLIKGFQNERARVVLVIGETGSARPTGDPSLTLVTVKANDWAGILNAIAGAYVAGAPVDWKMVESPWRRQRLALPAYPFQRQDCWLKFPDQRPGSSQKTSQKQVHPMLGRRIYSPQLKNDVVFEAEFDTEHMPFLKDHRFFSSTVVPAAAMMEMATAAGRIALRQEEVSLNDIVIEQPLLLPEGKTSLVQTVLTPEGADAYSFTILSTDIEQLQDSPSWKRHCSGKVAAAAATSETEAEAGGLNGARARYSKRIEPNWFYETVAKVGVEYGPSFRLMQEISCGDDGTLVRLELPDKLAKQSLGFAAHPGLLDSALQALGITYLLEHPDSQRVYMPVGIERFQLSLAGNHQVLCLATRRPGTGVIDQTVVGDLRFFTTAGKPIGELHGVCFKLNAKKEFLQKAVDRKLTNWLYETRWEPLSTLPAATQMQGTLLIVSDGNPVAAELAKVVRDGGARAITAQSGSAYSQQGSDSFISRFSSIADCEQLLKAAMAPGQPLTRVIFFAAGSSAECVDGPAVPRLASWQTEQLLYLTQALAQNAAGELPSLAVVAQGFQLPNIGIRSSLAGTAAWGLGRAVTAELPELHCKLIDIERALPPARAAEMLAAEISCESDENQVALGDGKRLALRLAHAEASIFGRENAVVADPRNPVQMEIAVRGDFKQLRFVPQKLKPPGPGEVQLRMLATALNFRDVLNALGMYPGDPGPLGVECIGEIVALGPGVSGWSVGEQVMAMPFRGYCTYSNAPVNMIFRRPANLSLAEAATVLTGYLTAIYSLSHLGNMKAGDRVLIHAGAGGVGLAAVQLAQQAGAEIFATAGSPAKREYLRQLGVPHVMDSRSLDFAATIRELTAGQGIDLVLNSLTGPAITEGLSLLKPGGSFLEIGKNELLNPAQVLKINPKAKYYVVDLVPPFRDTPQLMNQLVASITTSLEAGKLRPLPYRTFSLSEAPDAFRYMAAARHIGKVVVLHHSASQLDASSTYLITGGLGGLGLAVARWMVDGGARQIILVGRRAPNPAAAKAIADLQAAGAKVAVAQADVGDRQQLADLLAAHTSAEKPLRGVIHAAGLIDDGALLLQDWPRFARVLKPKIDGAWNLHELTLPMPLDFFVLFSSGAGLFGNPGQSSYAAANVFLDELAVARQAAGLPALSINWGPWAEVGMAAAMNQRHEEDWSSRGLSTIDPAGGLKLLEMMIARNQIGQMAVLPVDDSAWRPAAGRAISPLIKNLVGAADTEKDQASSGTAQASERLRQAAPADRRNVMIELVGETVLEIFGLDRRRSIPPDQNLTTLGMDSLLAIQLSNRLKTSFAASVPSTLTFQYPTIEAIADYLLKALSAGDEAAGPSGNGVQREVSNTNVTEDGKRRSPQQAETILANLHQLSDRDVETLLRGMERKRDSA